MGSDSRNTVSVWMTEPMNHPFPPLNSNETAEVCVIGAGIAGLSAAYELARDGRPVIVLEAGRIGDGETARTTAHLSCAFDDRYFNLEKTLGKKTHLAAESHMAAIDRIESIVRSEQIDCGFERLDGYLFAPPKRSARILGRELKAARRAGLTDVELVARAPIESFDTGAALRFPNQGQFHPLRYLEGLIRAIILNGGKVFSNTLVTNARGGSPVRITTKDGFTVSAQAAIVATNSPFIDVLATHTKQYPYRTYAIGAPMSSGAPANALYWDTLDPYHYVRLHRDLLIVGGEDHKTGQDDDPRKRFRSLERWARQRFPVEEVTFRWSGQVMETLDGLAFIGKDPGGLENVYIATGDSGMGMTHGVIAGMLLRDLIAGQANAWAEIYDPARMPLRTLKEFAIENVNVAAQYVDWLTPGDVDAVDQIPRDEGAVIRQGLGKTAVYKDANGESHSKSAVCPHLGCIVQWNNVEKTWDCPCHGSQFDRFGAVIHGPAASDLEDSKRTRDAA